MARAGVAAPAGAAPGRVETRDVTDAYAK
jgi:hypothetical protein